MASQGLTSYWLQSAPTRIYDQVMQREQARARRAMRWPSPDASLVAHVKTDRGQILQVYRIKPELIGEHFGTEQSVLSSVYRYRQIFEAVQSGCCGSGSGSAVSGFGGNRRRP